MTLDYSEKSYEQYLEEHHKKVAAIQEEAERRKTRLEIDFGRSHNPVKCGDIISDHMGKVLVDKITVSVYDRKPSCVYWGVKITASGKPFKSGERRCVHQTNLNK